MKKIINIVLCLFIIICINGCGSSDNNSNFGEGTISSHSVYALTNEGGPEELDLAFLKLTNDKENELYSPLSIKYALSMLNEGAGGTSKAQLDSILNGYTVNKYTNSKNLSLANMFAIKDTLKDNVSDEFKNVLNEKYNADFLIEKFEDPTTVNNWISEKTLGMIENFIDSYDSNQLFLLINALAIDMEWISKVQNFLYYYPQHENYSKYIQEYDDAYSEKMVFNGYVVKGLSFAAIANKYDIINEIGEESIRQTVKDDLSATIKTESFIIDYLRDIYGGNSNEETTNNFLNEYIKEISENYGEYKQSTDFSFYVDDEIKVFAKDLKVYDGTQFQYIGIMPKNKELSSYVEELNKDSINKIIDSLVEPSYGIFEEGYVTEVVGTIPTFNFTYNLDLNKCLEDLGITDIFDINKANFSKIVGKQPVYIDTKHKSTIEFSNEGIKASAISYMEGLGAAFSYDYYYDVPIKTVDLTFDKPFLFLIRNKDTGDVWFVGTLYEGNVIDAYITVTVDNIRIRKEPSTSSEKIGLAKQYDSLKITGNIVEAEGYTWYELAEGGWIADNNGEWLWLH